MMSKAGFVETRAHHRALTQLHRWWQLYEAPVTDARMARHLEILDADFVLEAPGGQSTGHAAFVERFHALPVGARHAHHLQRAVVTAPSPGVLALEAEFVYQRATDEGPAASRLLRYNAELSDADGLPVFTKLRLTPLDGFMPAAFSDAHAENRARSFVHVWLSQMEALPGEPTLFRELIADDGAHLDLGGAVVTDDAGMAQWRQGKTRYQKSRHLVRDLRVIPEQGGYTVHVILDWLGVDSAGGMAAATSDHTWRLDETDERFPRISRLAMVRTPHAAP